MEVCGLEQVQTLIQLAIKSITEPFHLLRIGINVMPAILAQAIELLSIVIHCVRSLSEGQQLPHLPIHQSLGDVMALESLLELIPSHSVPLLH
jgi:hypothetical protein